MKTDNELWSPTDKLKNIHTLESIGSVINCTVRRGRSRAKWLPFFKYRSYLCAYTRGIYAYVCKIWSFYYQTRGQEDCPQTKWQCQHQWWHMTDNSWLHGLLCQMSQSGQHKRKYLTACTTNMHMHGKTIYNVNNHTFNMWFWWDRISLKVDPHTEHVLLIAWWTVLIWPVSASFV